MTYTKTYTVDNNHIDVQGVMDGLYYPFYIEECRHSFARDVLGFDLEEQAKNGVNMVLSEYTLKFKKSLVKDDEFQVTCTLLADPKSKVRIHFQQEIIKEGKIMTSATFTATCIPAAGGRPFIPESLQPLLENAPVLGG